MPQQIPERHNVDDKHCEKFLITRLPQYVLKLILSHANFNCRIKVMGIKHFWIWFRENCADSIETMNKNDARIYNLLKLKRAEYIDTLAIDMNGIFHDAAQRCYKYGKCAPFKKRLLKPKAKPWVIENKFFEMVAETIEFYRNMVRPTKRLLLCVDGVAGAAKMGQQRQRRFRNSDTKGMPFNPNSLTPGTEIMDKLTYYLDWYFKTQITCNPEWHNLEIIFSNEKVPGEGEHKIVRYLRNEKETGEKVCIHGMDADLIMLGLAVPVEKVYILRDDSFNEDVIHFVDLCHARRLISARMSSTPDLAIQEGTRTSSKRVIKDFILMCYTVGNDFLPQIPGIEILQGGIDSLLSSYSDIEEEFGYLTRSHSNREYIRRNSFQVFLEYISELEKPMLEIKISKLSQFFADPILESALSGPDGNKELDMEAYKNSYYNAKFPGISVEEICHQYIRGLQWVLLYYTSGIPSWSWFYPWDYSPFISDVCEYFETYKAKKYANDQPLLPFQQLITVLPPESNNLIVPELRHLVSRENPILKEYFPKEIVVDLAGKRREWEGIARIPKADYKIFMREYDAITLPKNRDTRRNIPGKAFKYVKSENSFAQKSPWGRATFNVSRMFCSF